MIDYRLYKSLDKASQIHLALLALCVICIPLSTSLGSILYAVAAAFSIIVLFKTNEFKRLITTPLSLPFLTLFALVLMGIYYTAASPEAIIKATKNYLWLLLTPVLIYAAKDLKYKIKLIELYLIVILLTTLISYVTFLLKGHVAAAGIFKDHIVQSLLLGLALAISLYRAILIKQQPMLYTLYSLIIGLNMVFISESVTSYIMLFLTIGYFCLYFIIHSHLPLFKTFIISISSLVLVCFIVVNHSSALQSRLDKIKTEAIAYQQNANQYTSLGVRINNWVVSYKLFQEKPLLGWGTGGVEQGLKEYLNKKPNPYIKVERLFDTGYLNILVQYGLLGLITLLVLFATLWWQSGLEQAFEQYLLKYIVSILIVVLLFNPWLTSSVPTHLFSILFVLCFSRFTQKEHI